MDRVILAQKLESLRRCTRRAKEKTPPTVGQLIQDPDAQDILVLNLTRAVQLCVDIGSHVISESEELTPTTMGEVFSTLEKLGAISSKTCDSMKKSVGFRNVAVHNYDVINWEIVFAISREYLVDFRRFAKEITDYFEAPHP